MPFTGKTTGSHRRTRKNTDILRSAIAFSVPFIPLPRKAVSPDPVKNRYDAHAGFFQSQLSQCIQSHAGKHENDENGCRDDAG